MFLRIIEMLVGNVFVTLVTMKLFRIIRSKVNYLDIAIFGFIWIYVTTLYTLILGIFGLLESHKIAIISIIGLVILLSLSYKNLKHPRLWLNSLPSLHFPRMSLIGIILCILAFLQLARIIVHIWFIPPYVWDTVVYHLVNVAEWVQKERIYPVITPVGRVYWPASFELLETWFVVFLHHDLLIKVGPFLYYLATGASAYALARSLKLNGTLSAIATILYLFTPSLAIQATACKNDVGISAVFLFSIAIIVDFLVNGRRDTFPLHRQILLVIMALCLGIGIKPYMAFISLAPAIIGFWALWKYRKTFDILSKGHIQYAPTKWGKWDFGIHYIFMILIVFSLFLGSYWYIRNWVVFANPLHPTDFRIGSHLIFGTGDAVQFGPGQRGSASLAGMWENLRSFVTVRIFDKSGAYSSHLSDMSGWGWFNFVCGLPALLYALIFVKHLRLIIITFLLSLISLFTFISIDPWYMRFTLWFPITFALSFAFLIQNLSYKWLKALLLSVAMICAILNWIAVLNVGEISLEDFQKMMSMPALQRSTAELTHQYDGAYKKALQIIPKDEVIGVCFPNNGWAYPLYDADFSRYLEFVPIEDMQFTRNMKQRDIHYLFIERIVPEQTELIQKAVKAGSLKKIEEFLYALK
jgi:hypothetical protein